MNPSVFFFDHSLLSLSVDRVGRTSSASAQRDPLTAALSLAHRSSNQPFASAWSSSAEHTEDRLVYVQRPWSLHKMTRSSVPQLHSGGGATLLAARARMKPLVVHSGGRGSLINCYSVLRQLNRIHDANLDDRMFLCV